MRLTETSEGGVERGEGGDDSHATTSLGDGDVAGVVAGGEEPEGDFQEKEDEEERDRGAESTEQEDEGDDGPHRQVDRESVVEHVSLALILGENLELGNVQHSEGEPERAVRRERRGTESVTARPLLDAGDDLGESSVAKSETKDDVGDSDVTGLGVVERKDKGGTTEAGRSAMRALARSASPRDTHARRPRGAGFANLRWKTGNAGWLVSMGLPPGVMKREMGGPAL